MKVFPPTEQEQTNGYGDEKREYLKTRAIHTPDKLVIGKNYANLTNGYHVGVYVGSKFVNHSQYKCGCNGYVYNFVITESDGNQTHHSRGETFIQTIGLYEITD